jgi:ankyrin repeat protein
VRRVLGRQRKEAGVATLLSLVVLSYVPSTVTWEVQREWLFQAIRREDAPTVQRLLKQDRSLARPGSSYTTPLSWAAVQGKKRIVELLLDHYAKTKTPVEASHLQWAFESAVWEGERETGEFLLTRGAKLTIHTAAGMGWKEKVAEFLDHNPELIASKLDRFGCGGPLYWAIAAGQTEMVAYLLAKGADANEKNLFESTPLHVAANRGRIRVAELLCAYKADVNGMGACGRTPLFEAACAGKTEMVRWLLAHKADVNRRSTDGMIQAFRPSGFFGDDGEPLFGSTPLHEAVKAGHESVVSLLLAHKANVNVSAIGGTPLDCALANNFQSIANLLRAHGAKQSKKR